MILRTFGLLAPLVLGGVYFAGGFGFGGYSRDVDRPPSEVMAAIQDLDVRREPGSPGTDPSASGGVEPLFRTEQTDANTIAFVVMSGDKVATRMIAHLEPLDGGARTRVTAEVERGDAPDDFVSPAFRSEGLTLALFSMALEGELDDLVAPQRLSREACQELEERLLAGNAPAGDPNPASLRQGLGQGARTIIALNAVEAELRRNGCPTDGGGPFEPISNVMGDGGSASAPTPGVNFQPGQPMVDVSRH